MKKFFLIILLNCIFILISCEKPDIVDNAKTFNPADSLIAYWSFDNSDARDYSGNNNNAFIFNNVSFVDGLKGKAAHLVGKDIASDKGGHIILPSLKLNTLNQFTISMWVKEEGKTSEDGVAYIFFGNYSTGWLGILNHWARPRVNMNMYVHYATGAYYIDDTKPSINTLQIYFPDSTWKNKWCFYSIVYKDSLLTAYKNNEIVGSLVQKTKISIEQGAIGRHWWASNSTATRLIGDVDEVRIYSKALSKEEIDFIYKLK